MSAPAARDRRSALVVWLVWAAAAAAAALYVLLYGSDVPHLDEWQMIGPAATRCPRSATWFFAPNNEHRLPLPKAVYCGLMMLSGSDFRSGMIVSVLLFAGISAALIAIAARVRGRPSIADAFFPLLLLHWGHSENFLHSFQIAFTLPIALVALLAGAMLARRTVLSLPVAVLVALSAAALPFCSVVGLALTPPAVVWLLWSAYDASRASTGRGAATILLGGALSAGIAMVLFVANFPRPGGIPPSPGAGADLAVFTDLVLNGLGPGATAQRALYLPAVIVVTIVAVYGCVRSVAADRTELRRGTSALLLLATIAALLAGIAHARAGFGSAAGSVNRYVSVASVLYLALFSLALIARPPLAAGVQLALLLLIASAAPINYQIGWETGRDLSQRLAVVSAEARAGAAPGVLAERYRERLLPWASTGQLTYLLSRLREAQAGPYRFLRSNPAGHAPPP